MQPYQKASEEIKRQGELPSKVLKTAGSLAASTGTSKLAGIALNRVLPFLSEFISPDLARKGLSKSDSRFGNFINKAESEGYSFDDIKEFIKEKMPQENKSKSALQAKNIIEEHAPSLHEFLVDNIGKGIKPLAAAYQSASKFKKEIKDLEKKTGQKFSDIVSSIFGGQEQAQIKPESIKELLNDPNVPTMGQMGQKRGGNISPTQTQRPMRAPKGGGDAALAQAFQKILNM